VARIVVFTGNLSYSVRKGIDAIDRALPGTQWLVLVHAPRKPLARLLRNQWSNLKRNGWRWIPYQLGDIAARLGARLGAKHPQAWRGIDLGQAALAARPHVRIEHVSDIHAGASLEAVRAFAPDLGLSLAAPILRRPLFALPRLGTLNLHKGKVPDYRGMPPAFWELSNGEASVGCTVHWVDDKLDTGDVVASVATACGPYATVKGMQLRLDEVGVSLMREAAAAVLEGRAQASSQAAGGATWRKPTLAQAAALDARLLRRQGAAPALLPELAKRALAALALAAWAVGAGRLLAPRVTVLLYHRVSDDARDNLTVGIEQFDRQMALLRRHCEVLSIEQVLALGTVARSARPLVCVTFDDGYLDNYENAAQVLLRHQVPAAFFVSTGLIGTERAFPHDVRRGNAAIPMMDWDQLRAMRAAGFTIGSHTVNHIDCAAEPEQLVRAELETSRAALRRELGLDEVIFAYPYGGRRHMTAERLALVKAAGYAGCLSAYGGVNVGKVDPFNVVRRGIHWEFQDHAFRLACLGLKG
jgi:peptidoglycan/xylan/chitin deacetylase (PgdA/CDA1 family)